MPRVPTFSEQTVQSRGIPNARLTAGGANLAGAFQSVAGAARGVSQVFAAEAQEERDRADNAAVIEAETALDTFENDSLFNPQTGAFTRNGKDAFDLPNQVLPGYDKEVQRLEEGLGSDRAKLAFKQRAARRRGTIGQQLNRHESQQRDRYYDQQDEAGIASSRGIVGNYFNNPERIASELAKQELIIDARGARQGSSAEQIAEQKRRNRSDTQVDVINRYLSRGDAAGAEKYFGTVRDQIDADAITKIEGVMTAERRRADVAQQTALVDRNAAGILETYERKGADAGRQALEALSKSDIPVLLRDEIRGKVNAGVSRLRDQRRQENADLLAEVELSLAEGSASRETFVSVERLYERGALTPEERATKLGTVQRAIVRQSKDQADIDLGARAIRDSIPLDPANAQERSYVDKAFKASTVGVDRASPEYRNAAIDIARRTNIIPKDAISFARGQIAGEDPEAAANASRFLAQLEDANPAAYRYVEEPKLKAYVAQVNDAIEAGTPVKQAVALAKRNTYEVTEAEQKAYKQRYSAEIGGPAKAASANAEILQGFLNSENTAYDQAIFSGAPAAPIGLQAEFNAGVERYYQYTAGDLDQSRALAFRDVKRKWGYSTVNGSPELLPFAPEVMFPSVPVDLIKKDLKDAASKIGLGVDNPRLVQSPATAGTGGREWYIGAVDEFGSLEIQLDSDNRPYRYEVPTGQSLKGLIEAEAKQRVDEAREAAKERRKLYDHFYESAMAGDENAAQQLIGMRKPARGIK